MGKKKILIADDNLITLKMLKNILTESGYLIYEASKGKDALRIAKQEKPHLIILEIMMPGMDGGEIANALRNDIETRNIPIFFLSSLITKSDEKCTTKDEVTCLLSKPYIRKDLIEKIEEYCSCK